MKLSLNWLNSYFKNKPNWDEILHKLTMAGIEVEDIEAVDNDKVIEFKITPNRGDALSINGLLREIEVLTNCSSLKPAQDLKFNSAISDKINIHVDNQEACPHYYTLIIKNIDNTVKLPDEIVDRLVKSGNRSVSPVVDLTNYVMLELGQPLHAFDFDKVGNKLGVRFARDDESLELLVDITAKLNKKTLIITDEGDNPVAIAGVMGGKESGVIETTKNIVLESALFMPQVIAGQTKHYAVSSDAAYRFERGVDPQLQGLAIKYAATLITKYCGGQIGEITNITSLSPEKIISIDYEKINGLIGISISKEIVNNILIKLGFIIDKQTDSSLTIKVPSHRFDITIKEDIVEEIARVYGYDSIEPIMPVTSCNMGKANSNILGKLKEQLVSLGYSEIVSYAFLEEQMELLMGNAAYIPVKIQNPIANLGVMRTSLIANLVKTLENNVNRGHKHVKVFELARVFYGETEGLQPLKLAGLAYGNWQSPGWCSDNRLIDFYDLRNDVELLLSGLGEIKFVVSRDNPVFHSGRCAKIHLCGKEIGIIGQLHPKYKSKFNFVELPYVFELDVESIINANRSVLVHEVSKFQKVERDLAFIMESNIMVGDVIDKILKADIPYLVSTNVFDVYCGDKLSDMRLDGKPVKSVAINFIFQGNKTLTDDEINASIAKIQKYVEGNFLAQLRV